MSAIGVALGRAVGGLGGPQAAALIIAGGLVVGALGGAAVSVAGRPSTPAVTEGQLPVYPCPDTGPALLTVQSGQELLVTGRTEDATWLRIHYPLPGRAEAWIQAAAVSVAGPILSLPVGPCISELAIAPPSVIPEASLTAIMNNPASPGPTELPSATTSAGPTATPNTKPKLASLTVSTRTISYDTDAYCRTAVKRATFKVRATDATGLRGVTLFWREPGATSYARSEMTRVAGTATSGTWQVTLDTTANGITKAGKLAYYAVGTDTAGATRRIPSSGADSITVAVCANKGPTISSASSSSGSSLSWDPLGVGRCQTATNITAVIKDVDGVKSATLFYRRPGSSTWSSKAMTKQSGGKWYANLDTLGDKITIPKPPTGTLSWYIRAVDAKNVSSKSSTKSITIRRCDSEAQFDGVSPLRTTYSCTSTATILIQTYANDADQPNDGLKVVFYWKLTNPRTGAGPISGHMTANVQKGNYYRGTTATFDGPTFYYSRLDTYAVTTDRYGGTTKSATYTYTLSAAPTPCLP